MSFLEVKPCNNEVLAENKSRIFVKTVYVWRKNNPKIKSNTGF